MRVGGLIAPLIEVGAGLHPELTGRENIFLNASILGVPRKEIKDKVESIVAFAELDEFIDTPVKRYSTGMNIRLGFSIATCIDADILIINKVLAVGDLAFQRKCFDRLEDRIKNKNQTVLVLSHNIRQIERLFSRAILLEKGPIIKGGSPHEVCDLFYEKSNKKIKRQSMELNRGGKNIRQSGEVELLEINNNNGICHYYMGFSYYKLGDYDNAKLHAVRALELNIPEMELHKKLEKVK